VATVHGAIGRGGRPYYHEFGFLLLGKRDDCCRIHSDKGKTEIGSKGKMQPFLSAENSSVTAFTGRPFPELGSGTGATAQPTSPN